MNTTKPFAPTLRLVGGEDARPAQNRIIAVVSGKGGVGKTTLSLNLALALVGEGQSPLVVDGDLGLGKIDLLLGAEPAQNLGHVLLQGMPLEEAVFMGPCGIGVLPGSFGNRELAVLNALQRERLLAGIRRLRREYPVVLLDLSSGIGPNPVELARAADEVIVVTTPEPAAYADAYALMKAVMMPGKPTPRVVVNRAKSYAEARETQYRLSATAHRHLSTVPTSLGFVPEDSAVQLAAAQQRPLMLTAPLSPAGVQVREIARRLVDLPKPRQGAEINHSFRSAMNAPEFAGTLKNAG